MPKFARPNSYNGRQSTQQWTGSTRAATIAEAAEGLSTNLYISPATMGEFLEFALTAPGPIGSAVPNTGKFTTLDSSGGTILALGAGAVFLAGNATSNIGFFGSVGTTRQAQPAITNSVITQTGVANTVSNYTDLAVYANDANAIKGNFYQIGQALAKVISSLRGYGLLN
jgi:hypothetical protein